MPVAISIKNLSKAYPAPFALGALLGRAPRKPSVEALRDVSFDVQEGEIFGLIGPNGAGKTTLTKIIATLVQPTTGTVTVKGFDSVKESADVRGVIGLAAAEERSFYWRLTLEQNLMFFARLYSIPKRKARARVSALLAQLDLENSARQRFGQLSTGNKQRMAIARALLNEPPILLLDEPTRSLDPLAAARMRELIRALAEQDPPVTILLTSHNLAEVETLCARVAVISRGRIRAIDTPKNLRDLTSGSETVHITVSSGEKISLTRQHNDDRLDEKIRELQAQGVRIIDVETERATLLDVLERYESAEER